MRKYIRESRKWGRGKLTVEGVVDMKWERKRGKR